jgi:aminoglycoside phosphotransferase family enzyme
MDTEGPPLDAKLRFVREHLAPVEVIETHMSWLLLSSDRVHKLKKPVRYPFLDFATVAAREHDAREELRLNRRLAPAVYLGLAALQWDGERFTLVSEEVLPTSGCTVVDWLVVMRRLPADRMLDGLLLAGRATPAHVDALADVLVAFYRRAPRIEPRDGERVQRLCDEQATHREVLTQARFALRAAAVLDRLDEALRVHATELAARPLVDGHGDLRPEHVCLVEPPVVIDCLEFNPALRRVDPFDELAFLGLECAMLGAPWVGPRLVEHCALALGDAPPPQLLHLYTAARAVLRARLAAAHLLEPDPRTPQKWLPLAARYLERASEALDALDAG